MIAPLPLQPGLPQPADLVGAKPDPRGEGDAFAEILAAAGAMPAPRLPGPLPAIEHGPAVVHLTGPMPAEPVQPALTDPAAPGEAPSPDQPKPAARIFNQDGFFGSGVDRTGHETLPAETAAAPTAMRTMPSPVDPPSPPPAGPSSAERSPAPAMPLSAAVRPATAPPAAAIPRLPRIRSEPLAVPAATRPVAFEAEAEAEPARPLARRLAVRDPAARNAVQVAIRELEQGVHVAARAEGLDAAERARLQDEIAALLARHGLSARSIRISAPQRSARSEERLK